MSQNTAVMTQQQGQMLEQVLIGGDLSRLAPADKVMYYKNVCESMGLNPLTKPFEYIRLNGKEVLYALRSCTEQLRKIHGVSVIIVSREAVEDCYVVTARATDKTGRNDESIGAVPIKGLSGEARANAYMKAETKAKRRVTLAICGLGMLDESEADSIAGAYPGPITPTTGAMQSLPVATQEIVIETATEMKAFLVNDQAADAYALWKNSKFDADEEVALWSQFDSKQRGILKRMDEAERAQNAGVISPAKHKRLEALIKEHKLNRDELKAWCVAQFNKHHFTELSNDEYMKLDEHIASVIPKAAPVVENVGSVKAEHGQSTVESGAALISAEQIREILSLCEMSGVNISRLLLASKLRQLEDMPAGNFNRAIEWISKASKGAK